MLHRATGETAYLERAERCLLNHLYFNQFSTGDFGHRVFFEQGVAPTESVGRSWWCCTMHGYRAFAHVLHSVVRVEDGTARVNLYQDFDWGAEGFQLAARYRPESPMRSRFTVEVKKTPGAAAVSFRRPSWADSVTVTVDGSPASVEEGDSRVELRDLRSGDRVEVAFVHRAWLETRDGQKVSLADADGEIEGLLFVGPWLYVIDEGTQPLFFGEPWKGANVVSLPAGLPGARGAPGGVALLGSGPSHRGALRPRGLSRRAPGDAAAHRRADGPGAGHGRHLDPVPGGVRVV